MRKAGYAFLVILLMVIIVFGVIAYKTGIIFRYDSDRTFHSPVFGNGGKEIYFLSRTASGISWGPGIEFFTSPAKIVFLSDRFSLMSMDVSTKKTRLLCAWEAPHEKSTHEQYRNRLFGYPGTGLSVKDNRIYFAIGVDIRKDGPNSRVNEWLVGYYDINGKYAVETKKWEQSNEMPDQWPEDILSGDLEVINYRNKAILLSEGKTGKLDVLMTVDDFRDEEIRNIPLEEYSHRKQIERIRTLRETNKRLVEQFREAGLSEGEAMLKAGDELEKMGLYPKTPKITAIVVAKPGEDYAAFPISREEFLYGLFPDIEKAIKDTGAEVGFWGNYIKHRDFDTSKKINEYLAEGNKQFYVITEDKTYLMTIIR